MQQSQQDLSNRLREQIIISSAGLRFLYAAIGGTGGLLVVASVSLQLVRVLGGEVSFEANKIVSSATQLIILMYLIGLRIYMRPEQGWTVLERVAFRILMLSVLAAMLLAVLVYFSDQIEPLATNGLLALIHFITFAAVPLHITRSFFQAGLVFVPVAVLLAFYPLLSDGLYGLAWLVATLVLLLGIRREARG